MKRLILSLIKFYQRFLSPSKFGVRICKFEPSCSKYMYKSIEKFGILKGAYFGFLRLFRCNPLSKGGFDPVK